MAFELRFQDPAEPTTRYLFEELVGQLRDPHVTVVEGVFAFASQHGVLSVLQDPAFVDFLARGTCRLIVGLDAVTDRRALEALALAQTHHPGLTVKVFKNRQSGLFHPKLSGRATVAGPGASWSGLGT